MKVQRKRSHIALNKKRQIRRAPEAGQNEHLTRSEAPFSSLIAFQHNFGNQAVQRLLAINEGSHQIQKSPTPLGANVAMRDNEAREHLLQQLLTGSKNIGDYTGGSCYDAAAYIQYLRGQLTFEDLSNTGTGLLPLLNLEAGTLWAGDEIPIGSAVGFKRISGLGLPGSGGFFHVGVGVGSTNIRAVNGHRLGAGWIDVVNLAQNDLLAPQSTPGTYLYDHQPIQVWYR